MVLSPSSEWSNVFDFMQLHRVDRGCEFTHTSLLPPISFYVPAEELPTFYSLYALALDEGKVLHITEKTRHIGPIVVDLDFRYDGPTCQRHHSPEQAKQLAQLYSECIGEYLETPASGFRAFIMERPAPYLGSANCVKDGIHLVFPDVNTRVSVKRLIRHRFLARAADLLGSLGSVNPLPDIVDEAVIAKNNWLMHGSCKPNTEPYRITQVWSFGGQETEPEENLTCSHNSGNHHLVRTLSIRNKYEECPIREAKQEVVSQLESEEEVRRRQAEAMRSISMAARGDRQNNTVTPEQMEQVQNLVAILSPARADGYGDWIRLGWCLRNIDHRLLPTWVEFSAKSKKYKNNECERLWDNMREGGLGMGTLHMWAKQDAPDAYAEMMRKDLKALILHSLSGTHYDIAKVVYHLYSHTYVCSSVKHRTWYEFRNHRWHESDSGIGLRLALSDTVWREYNKTAVDMTNAALATADASQQSNLQETSRKLLELAAKLRMTFFKENVMRECSEQFYVEKFEEKLDADPNLICFENGVYDLTLMQFREGRPEDYISYSTGIDYAEYDPDSPYVLAIQEYLSQVFVKEHMRDYVLKLFASFLSGLTKEQKFYIWTGSGANSKSMLVNLFEKSFGDYCCKFPITLLTQKRAASNAATSELARAKGKRFGCLQEPSDDEKLNIGLMKELSGGDKIMARAIYKEPVEFRPMFKLLLLCNQLPAVPSDDGGTWRRIRVVEFTSKFVDKPNPNNPNEFQIDYELAEKMEKWPEHFMALVLQYWKRYCVEGLVEPEEVLKCTLEYKAQNDYIALYLLNRVDQAEDAFVALDDLYSDFKTWAREDGILMPKHLSKPDFEKCLVRNMTKTSQHMNMKGFKGYKLRPMNVDETTGEIIF